MCMLFVYFDDRISSENDYSLIIANNRDEIIYRPTKDADFWSDDKHCIGGIDIIGGGTWLAASKRGKIGILLNVPTDNESSKISRGLIVKDYVTGCDHPKKFLESCFRNELNFNGYNLVLFHRQDNRWEGYYYCNNESNSYLKLESGCHVFSNCPASKPWKKISYGKNLFKNIVRKWNNKEKKEKLKSELVNMLKDNKKILPDKALDEQLSKWKSSSSYSSIFVIDYETLIGTRTHTIILGDRLGKFHFEEMTMNKPYSFNNSNWKLSKFDF